MSDWTRISKITGHIEQLPKRRNTNFKKQKPSETRRERPKSAPHLRFKNIQGTTIGNLWKNFFSKTVFDFKKSRTMPKTPKRGHLGSLNVFYKPKTSKNATGYPLIKFKNLVSLVLLEA